MESITTAWKYMDTGQPSNLWLTVPTKTVALNYILSIDHDFEICPLWHYFAEILQHVKNVFVWPTVWDSRTLWHNAIEMLLLTYLTFAITFNTV